MKMNFFNNSNSFVFIISWLLYFFHCTMFSSGEQSCQLDDVFNNLCGENAHCFQEKDNSGICQCIDSYQLQNGKCIRIIVPSTDSTIYESPENVNGGSSVAFWIIVPCSIIALAGAIFFMIKRLKLVEKLYQFRVRRYNTVFVTSLQDDDAPIT